MDTINQLAWTSCPHCGTAFKVAVPMDATTLKPRAHTEIGENNFHCCCPKCNKKFTITYKDGEYL